MDRQGFPDGAIVLEGDEFDAAILGVTENGDGEEVLVYGYEKLVEVVYDPQTTTYEEAVEFIDFNTIRAIAYMGNRKPIVVYAIGE